MQRRFVILAALPLLLLPAFAQSVDDPIEPPDPLTEALDALESLEVELEARETPPVEAERERLTLMAERARLLVEASDAAGGEGTKRDLRRARKLLDRATSLELTYWVAFIVPRVEEIESRDEPPTEEELALARETAESVQAMVDRIYGEPDESGAKALPKGVQQATRVLRRLASLELLPLVAALEPWVAELEAREAVLTPAEVERAEAEIAASEEIIDQIRAGLEAEAEATLGVRRARQMIARLTVLELKPEVELLRKLVERLEALPAPPLPEQLAAARATDEVMRKDRQRYERTAELKASDEQPETVRQSAELSQRFALQELRTTVADVSPLVDRLGSRKKPPNVNESKQLRAAAETLRDIQRRARAKKALANETVGEDEPVLVREADDLQRRINELTPQAAAEEQRDAPIVVSLLRPWKFYGSMRAHLIFREGGTADLNTGSSRLGVRGDYRFIEKLSAFARVELAVNLLDELNKGGDSGVSVDTLEQSFSNRLAFVGLETAWGSVSYGKQWSAYYDVAVFSDQLPTFGGAGTAAFPAGTDGGVSGTGRADSALQYRSAFGRYRFAGQIQTGRTTADDNGIPDGWGASVVYNRREGVDWGIAYNRVRDGIPDPTEDEPKAGDTALIVGGRWDRAPWYGAVTVAAYQNHETDDLDRFFDGTGVEAYAERALGDKIRLRFSLSALHPSDDHPGDYRLLQYVVGGSYEIFDFLRGFLLVRIDGGTLSDGSPSQNDSVGVLVHYNF